MSKDIKNNNNNKDMDVSQVNEDTFLFTAEKLDIESLEKAMYDFTKKNNIESVYLGDITGSNFNNITLDTIDNLALNAQSEIEKIKQINNIVRYYINKNEILGKVYEAIEININPDIRLQFPKSVNEDSDIHKNIEEIINDFNEKIGLNSLITRAIPMAYSEGTYIMYLREFNNNFQVDYYPIGLSVVSDYKVSNEPYILIDIKELQSRLSKIYKKNKKNRPLFYSNMDEEIKATYPKEVYEAYKNKEQYAILNIENTGTIRINNMERKYGLTPMFKALKPIIRLENIETSDNQNTLVRGKKIIFQKLSKELFMNTPTQKITWGAAQAKAHMDLIAALKQKGLCVYTGLPWTESVTYVEPKLEQTNVQVKKEYKDDIMTSVGISYLSPDSNSVTTAQISVAELMKVINKISEQLENILYKWYRKLLISHGIDVKYTPKIKFLDSEQLSANIKMTLVELLYSKLNCSYETAYEVLGINAQDEYRRRLSENEKGYDEIFKPHLTSYTVSGKKEEGKAGRPSDKTDIEKQDYTESNDDIE